MVIDFDKKLGIRIRQIRDHADLSQDDLAKRLHISRVTLSQIENGQRKISVQEMAELSKIFDIPPGVLLGIEKDIVVTLNKSGKSEGLTRSALRINVPQKNVSKFREVFLYILKQVGSKPNIGELVLYKLLYFIDFDYYEKYEEQLIGATYIKNHFGPTPKEFAKLVQEMAGKDIVKVKTEYFKYPQTKYLPRREPDLSKLSARELEMIDQVIKRLSDMNATEISEYSHNDVPWLTTEDGKVIDYEAVFYRTSPYSVRSYNDKDVQ